MLFVFIFTHHYSCSFCMSPYGDTVSRAENEMPLSVGKGQASAGKEREEEFVCLWLIVLPCSFTCTCITKTTTNPRRNLYLKHSSKVMPRVPGALRLRKVSYLLISHVSLLQTWKNNNNETLNRYICKDIISQ